MRFRLRRGRSISVIVVLLAALVVPFVGCVQFSYPWLDMTAWGDGRGTGSVGG